MVINEVKGVTCLYKTFFFFFKFAQNRHLARECGLTQRKEAIAEVHRKSLRRVGTCKNILDYNPPDVAHVFGNGTYVLRNLFPFL